MERSLTSRALGLFSYEILGLVGRGGAGPHDLLRMARNGRMLDWAGESQYYVEPKRLARLGYLSARKEPGKTRERTVYSLTDKGLEALREYAATPAVFTPFKSDMLLRVMLADLVGEGPTREAVSSLRGEIAELSAQLDAAVDSAAGLPHREKYLLLVIDFLRGLMQLHLDWIESVERELAGDSSQAEVKTASGRRAP
jgi:PadR family transcriptional regulator, regulatory protein AphA